ncbi:MAG: bile acid:sodium symporter, partial [Bacteroidales bacterium]|nr:bile acid:sodium symporter [Bacteroidales bacterium]
MKRFFGDWFITCLFLMILAAWIKPGIGMDLNYIDLNLVINIGVILIFFFYGLKLDWVKMKAGMRNWKMHFAVQLTTFLLFPLLILPFYPLMKNTGYEILWLGMFFLAALPSTVSSSVVMVSIARGNIPGAIFNASISGIIGIVATPLWMSLFLIGQQTGFDFSDVILQLILHIIVPVVAGLVLHPYFVQLVNRYIHKIAAFDKFIILLIVYESFSRSFLSGIFSSVSWKALIGLCLAVVILFYVVLKITGILSKRLNFSRADGITLQFAGTKKSLVHGSVFGSVLFGSVTGAGILLLPIMIYHSYQLFYISIVA